MELVNDFIEYVSTWLRLLKNNIRIFKLEAKLAQLSLFRLFIAALIFFGIAIVTWISGLFILGYEIFHHTQDMLIAILAVFSINFLFLIGLIIFILRQIGNMQFRNSKTAIRALTRMQNNHENKKTETADSSTAQ